MPKPGNRRRGRSRRHIRNGAVSLARTLADIRRALEEAGIIFIDEEEDGEGAGIRLRKRAN